jgi:RNA polymerase sigma-70 factor (ECF subfamily)
MPVSTAIAQQRQIDDIDLVRRAAQRDRSAIRGIIKSHNQRLFRLARAIVTMEIANDAQIIPFPGNSPEFDPERLVAQRELLRLVEHAIDEMADTFRSVFVARVIEGLSVEETAEVLNIQPTTVKTRLHRARKMIRERLEAEIGPVLVDAFPFAGKRCDRLTAAVLDKLGLYGGPGTS